MMLLSAPAAQAVAGISYRFDRAAASPGETVTLEAVYFNDSQATVHWLPPRQLALQWRGQDGALTPGRAVLPGEPAEPEVPAGGFARLSWQAVVPAQASGMQAVSIEGEPALLALQAQPASAGAPLAASATAAGTALASAEPPARAAPPAASTDFGLGLSTYRPMYFLVGSRGGDSTARFQLSAKYQLFGQPGSDRFIDQMYLGYTQVSLWDLSSESMPFIDTTFNPSLFWYSDSVWKSQNGSWRLGLNTGVEHASNGKDGPDSRSLNNAYIQPSLNYALGGGGELSFAPRIKSYFKVEEENADYARYHGHVEWMLRWTARPEGPVLSAMYEQGDRRRRTTQLDLAWPLRSTGLDINGYLHLQYFNGYGETLLGYNQRNDSQFRIGVSFVP
jgi:outer membrane phospholipase A